VWAQVVQVVAVAGKTKWKQMAEGYGYGIHKQR
jgi:hypothetical protein